MKKILLPLMCSFFFGFTGNIFAMIQDKEIINKLRYLTQNIERIAENHTGNIENLKNPLALAYYMKPIIAQQKIAYQKKIIIPNQNIAQFIEYATLVIQSHDNQSLKRNHTEDIKILSSACYDLLLFSEQLPAEIKNCLEIIYKYLNPQASLDFSFTNKEQIKENNQVEEYEEWEEYEDNYKETTPIKNTYIKKKHCCYSCFFIVLFISYLVFKLSSLKEL